MNLKVQVSSDDLARSISLGIENEYITKLIFDITDYLQDSNFTFQLIKKLLLSEISSIEDSEKRHLAYSLLDQLLDNIKK